MWGFVMKKIISFVLVGLSILLFSCGEKYLCYNILNFKKFCRKRLNFFLQSWYNPKTRKKGSALWTWQTQKHQYLWTAKSKNSWFCSFLRRWLYPLRKPPSLTYALLKTTGSVIWSASNIFQSLWTPILCTECPKASAWT